MSTILSVNFEKNHSEKNDGSNFLLPSGYSIKFLEKAEIIIALTFGSNERRFLRTAEHFKSFDGFIHFLVAASNKVCTSMMCGNIYATCVDEIHFTLQEEWEGNLPIFSKLLQTAVDSSGPNVKWIGYMSGDIVLDNSILRLLPAIMSSDACREKSFRCAVTGQRHDIDEKTLEEKIHPENIMDYFLFTMAGVDYLLQDGHLPPFKAGLMRWDSWLMGYLVASDEVDVTDLSKVFKLLALKKSVL